MEQNLQRRMAGLKDKLPDIQKTLDTVRFLELRKVCTSAVAGVMGVRADGRDTGRDGAYRDDV